MGPRAAALRAVFASALIWGACAHAQSPAAASPSAAPQAPTRSPLRGQTVKIAWIDPLSGVMAQRGVNEYHAFAVLNYRFNLYNTAQVTYELRPFDNNLNQDSTLQALQAAIAWGARYIVQGIGAGVTGTLRDAVEDYNQKHSGHELLYLNYGTPESNFGNERCSYWQFRFDPDVVMRAQVLATYLEPHAEVKKIFLVNPNYPLGLQARSAMRAALERKRPDIAVVGDVSLPLAQTLQAAQDLVRDIQASAADAIITSSWGTDLTFMLQEMGRAGLHLPVYTFFAHWNQSGLAPDLVAAQPIYQVMDAATGVQTQFVASLRSMLAQRFQEQWYSDSAFMVHHLLTQAMLKAGSSEPADVAKALEGLRVNGLGGEVEMRKSDHQLQQSLWMGRAHLDLLSGPRQAALAQLRFEPVQAFPAYVAAMPTSCQMQRP